MTEPKGKSCPQCGEPMTDLSSRRVRQCTNGKCSFIQSWPLADKQPPLISSNRDKRK